MARALRAGYLVRGEVEPDALTYVGRVELGDAIDVEAALTQSTTGRLLNRYPLLILEAGRRP